MLKKYYTVASLLLVIVLLGITACAGSAAQPVSTEKTLNVGCIMPFSGGAALWGNSIRPGMELYAQLINEDGGIKIGNDTYKVNMIFKDGWEPAAAAAATRSLIYEDKVGFIVGYFGLGIAAISQISNPEKVVLNMTTIGGPDPIPVDKSYVFYGYPVLEMMPYQAISMMKAFPQYHTLGWTGVESGDSVHHSTFEAVDEKFLKDYGIKSVREYYPQGTLNFTPYITKLAEQGVDAIFSVGSPIELALLAKQRYALGYKWPIGMASCQLDTSVMKGLVGSEEAMQNIVADFPCPWEFKKVTVSPKYLDMAKRIWNKYRELNNKDLWMGAYGGACCNSMGQLFEVLEKAGTTDPDVVMRTVRGGTFDSFFGRYTLAGEKHFGSKSVFGNPCCMGIIKGMDIVYLGEYPFTNIDTDSFIEY